jgi:integrase
MKKKETLVKLYVNRAKVFLDWAGRRKITGKLLDQYVHQLAKDGKSDNTIATYFLVLKALYKFLGKEEELDRYEIPKFRDVEIYCPDKEDVDKMIAACVKLRDKALVTLQFGCGLRAAEMRRLDQSDLVILEDGSGLVIVESVKTRTKKEKVAIPISHGVVKALSEWLNSRDDKEEAIFPSTGKRKSKDGYITTETINYIYKSLCKKAGIEPAITSHQLRHACATWMLKQGVPKDHVKKICRWKDDSSIDRYDHLQPSDITGLPDPFPDEVDEVVDEEVVDDGEQ